ncbi:hypothetical protein PR202_ga19066 [Eleusine coracana subsp. coracana]|uniref:Uncharacterized protein n=1 Tax=Eleusine coracana subsp. coracana TaxID=191504 RepID=A0AAV5CUF2_ELECO|nr:hypothetical protein PR202_ga19066 [Eleusine coracana subsp. coracana]
MDRYKGDTKEDYKNAKRLAGAVPRGRTGAGGHMGAWTRKRSYGANKTDLGTIANARPTKEIDSVKQD